MDALLSGLMGILGGIISGLVIAILSQRKNEAEIRRIDAETRKINTELENTQTNERKGIFTEIHHLMHTLLGSADYLGRPDRGRFALNDKSDEYILGFVEKDDLSKFEIQKLLEAEDKSKFYQELDMWSEFLQLQKDLSEFHNYIVEKEILLDDEEFVKACKDLERLVEMYLKNVKEGIRNEDSDFLIAELYRAYKPEFDPYETQIDQYIKSQLRPKRNKS